MSAADLLNAILHSGREDWKRDAACRGADPAMFIQEGAGRPDKRIREAQLLCGRCPVQEPCLQYALETPPRSDFGVWGGTLARHRDMIRKERRDDGS